MLTDRHTSPGDPGKTSGRTASPVETEIAAVFGPQILTSGCVGQRFLDDATRRETLSKCGLQEAIVTICGLFAGYDQALRLGHSRVTETELEFLGLCEGKAAEGALGLVKSGRSLFSPATLVQLTRETIEWATDIEGDSPPRNQLKPFSPDILLQLALSISASQDSSLGVSGTKSPEELVKVLEELADDQAQLESLESRMKLWEFARLQTNAVTTLDILLSDTFETWFKQWPPRAPHDLIGETPAIAFYESTGVELVDLIRLGRKLWSMGEEGVVVFSREALLNDSACPAAVDLLTQNAALPTHEFRDKLARERKAGNLTHRRYIFSQFPVLKLNDDQFVMLRPHWVADRLCGTQLYWQAFSGFGGPEDARAQQLSGAMNYVFERNVDYLLRRVHKRAPQSFSLIKEAQMQEQWANRSGPPSVCDWVLRAGNVCILLDATNHWLDFKLAQGLADEKHYVNDLEMAILKKVEQFSSTAKKLLLNGWDSTELGPETLFVPIIIVPNAGLPLTAISDLDLARRSLPILNGSADHFTAPGILTWQDLQVVEGLCQHRNPSGLIELLTGWRSTCTWEFPVRLQTYLDQNRLDRPIGSYPSVGRRLLDQILDRSE